jgi:serine protease Do
LSLALNALRKFAFIAPFMACLAAAETPAAQPAGGTDRPLPASSAAEPVYAAARPRLLQIRTLVAGSGRQSSIGSGFVVSADGLAISNYHVVSQYALEPATYRMEFATADGARGAVKLLAIDVANDLALIRIDRAEGPFFAFDERALTGTLPKGERLYAMGNPLDLGFTIVEGTYNGTVERSFNERIHFTAPINPGMSGGPAVTSEGRLIGINVAKQLGSDLVSFLVPGRFAAALLDKVPAEAPSPKELRAEIGRQLARRQTALMRSLDREGYRPTVLGPYEAPESAAPWFNCWGQTNAGEVPKPRADVSTTRCNSDTRIFVAGDLSTGQVSLTHSYLKSVDLNSFQFAALLSRQNQPAPMGWSRKWHTRARCEESWLAATATRPPLRAVWCARAYREFEGLYDVWLTTVTEDRSGEALVSRLAIEGIAYDNALAEARGLLDAIRWKK